MIDKQFAALGRWLFQHKVAVIIAWALLFFVASLGARSLPAALMEGTAGIPGSVSEHVDHVLATEFNNPFARMLAVTISSERFRVSDPIYQAWLRKATRILVANSEVKKAISYLDQADPRLKSADGHQTFVMVGLVPESLPDQQKAVPLLRSALDPLRQAIAKADPRAKLAVTGHAALEYDIDADSQRDTERSEARALPLTLLILLVAFGALVAAGIPLLMALMGVTIALGLAYLMTFLLPVSSFLQSVVTMVGLAVGIDYSLLIVNRFREALDDQTVDAGCESATAAAVVEVVRHTGPAIVFSGLTVMVGFSALLFTPLVELRSMGIGGALVVAISVCAANTLVPAVLGLLGSRVDAPRLLSWRRRSDRTRKAWEALALWVMQRPLRVLLVAAAVVLAIASPATKMSLAFSNAKWLPKSMESRTGLEALIKMGEGNSILPIYLLVRSTDGKPVVSPVHLNQLIRYAKAISSDHRVASLLSPVTLRSDLTSVQYLLLYLNLEQALKRFPIIGEFFLSKKRDTALFEVVPGNTLPIRECQQLAKDLARLQPGPPFTVEVGGQPVYYNDFSSAMLKSYPIIFSFVVVITLLVLFFAFRSFLLPIKAVIMNLLSVAAGYGAVVMLFQFGWGSRLIGLEEPLGTVMPSIPMTVFCVVFGLSMDYEVFLLSRIKECYQACGDNRQATAQGLAATGGIITSAAAIMVVVFGAFAFADIAIVKMVGLGLAVAVLVDATLVRIFLVPAFMRIAGRWNWYPGTADSQIESTPLGSLTGV